MAKQAGVPSRGKKKRPFRRKRRSWLFKIERTTNHGITGADLLASVCHRYSTVKKLVVKPASSSEAERNPADVARSGAAVLVEVRFAGPQPSESCGALLCLLLGGESVQAWPVELPRGRKPKKHAPSGDANDDVPGDAPSGAASVSTAGNSASGVLGILPPPPRRREKHDYGDGKDMQDRAPHPPEHNQRYQHPCLHGMHQHQHQHQHQPFGAHDTVSDPHPSFPAVQPASCGARSLQSELAGAEGGGIIGVCRPSFLALEGSARRASVGALLLPMEEVVVEPSRKECDWEGRPFPKAGMAGDGPPIAAGAAGDRQCHLVFTGLEETGHDLNSLRVTALFGVDAVHQTATMSGPLQVGADGRAYSSLFYPSLQEIWPELYVMPNIPVIEVDVEVEILSDSGGEYRYHGPQLKVAYHRTRSPAIVAAVGQSARGSVRAPIVPCSPLSHAATGGAGAGEFLPICSPPAADCL